MCTGMTNAMFYGNGDTDVDRYGTGQVSLAQNRGFGDDVASGKIQCMYVWVLVMRMWQ